MTNPEGKAATTKKAYAEPTVEEYGALRDLTTGGTQTTGETGGAAKKRP